MTPMNANKAAAGSARPLVSLSFQKGIHTRLFNLKQIIHHTHMILFPVALIQLLYTPAGKFPAGKAKCMIIPIQFLTVPDTAIHTVKRLLHILPMTAGAWFSIPQISHAKRTVHTAGGDMRSGKGGGVLFKHVHALINSSSSRVVLTCRNLVCKKLLWCATIFDAGSTLLSKVVWPSKARKASYPRV